MVMINLSILPTTLVVWKQLWGGSDRCVIKNVSSSAAPSCRWVVALRSPLTVYAAAVRSLRVHLQQSRRGNQSQHSYWQLFQATYLQQTLPLPCKTKPTKPTLSHTTTKKS